MTWLGLLVLACVCVHGGNHLLHRRPADLLWACHVGAAAVGIGVLLRSAVCDAIGVLFLLVGVPLWILDVATGGEFIPTSVPTHLGGLVVGLLALKNMGPPAGVWWKAALALAVLVGVCRLLTPAPANVNLAFAVPSGWRSYFPSHRWYLIGLGTAVSAVFFGAEQGLRKIFDS